MENTGGPRNATAPPRRCTEYGYLILGVVALTAAAVVFLVSQLVSAVAVPQGPYSILAGLFAVGGCGWIVRSADHQRARDLRAGKDELQAEVADLTAAVADLADQVAALKVELAQSRVTHLPSAQQRITGHRYFGAAAVRGTGDKVPTQTGLDPQAIADARTIARRLVDADTLPRQNHP